MLCVELSPTRMAVDLWKRYWRGSLGTPHHKVGGLTVSGYNRLGQCLLVQFHTEAGPVGEADCPILGNDGVDK